MRRGSSDVTDPILTKFRIAAKHEMSQQRMSSAELARRAGLSRQHLYAILHTSKSITLTMAARIAKALKKPLDFLIK